jgi:hypothetical protein
MTLPDELYLRTLLDDFGISPGESDLAYQSDNFTGDGSTLVFILSQTPTSDYPSFVYLSTILQNFGYTVFGTTLTFLIAPTSGQPITVSYSYA